MLYSLLIAPLLSSAIFPQEVPLSIDETSVGIHTEKPATKKEPNTTACNCVAFVRTKRPDIASKNAKDFTISTTTPFIGAVAKMYYPHSGMYHLAYVVNYGSNWVELIDANYTPCTITHRIVTLPDRILGYF